MTKDQFYGYASILIFVKVAHFLVSGNLKAWEDILGIRIQATLNSFLYRKSLKISSATSETKFGNIVTLITKDIHILEKDMWIIKECAIFFIELGTAASLLYIRIGEMCFVGLGLFVVAVIIQGW